MNKRTSVALESWWSNQVPTSVVFPVINQSARDWKIQLDLSINEKDVQAVT